MLGVADLVRELEHRARLERLDVEPLGEGARLDVARVARHMGAFEQIYDRVDELRVDQGAVAGDAHDTAFVAGDGAGEAREDIVARPAVGGDAEVACDGSDGIVDGFLAGRDDDPRDSLRAFETVEKQHEHRLSPDVGQRLARKPVRRHSRLRHGKGGHGARSARSTRRRHRRVASASAAITPNPARLRTNPQRRLAGS